MLPHVGSDEGLVSGIRFALEELVRGRLSGEGQGGQGVHDQVHP
jgi:hypothetical protein